MKRDKHKSSTRGKESEERWNEEEDMEFDLRFDLTVWISSKHQYCIAATLAYKSYKLGSQGDRYPLSALGPSQGHKEVDF